MSTCCLCANPAVKMLLDCGPLPLCNRFPADPAVPEFTHPFVLGQCQVCGVLQLVNQVPAAELAPQVNWITYSEPEGHLDEMANLIAGLPGLTPDSVIAGISFKDDSTLERLQRKGFRRTWRVDPRADLEIQHPGAGAETIQERLTPETAERMVDTHGQADLLITRHVLEHAHRPRAFLEALRRMVKPTAYLLFEVPDCARALHGFDYSTLWEEHTLYFTPRSFQQAFEEAGFSLLRFQVYPYAFENSLVAIVRPRTEGPAGQLPPTVLREETRMAELFAGALPERRRAVRRTLARFRDSTGKVALLGAGHLACFYINLLGLKDLIDFVVDDNPNKQGLCMPGSRLPIVSSAALRERGAKLCLLCVNPEVEDKVAKRNQAFVDSGGLFASIFPSSQRALKTEVIPPESAPMPLRRVNDEVLFAEGTVVRISAEDIATVKHKAAHNPRQRIRICAHPDNGDRLHEMLIVHTRDTYVRPHKHINKSESFHVIEGSVDVVLFDDEGNLTGVISMGNYASGKPFYYRISSPLYHTLLITSDVVVFHEATNGPFVQGDAVFAPWSPEESPAESRQRFTAELAARVGRFIAARQGRAPQA